MPSCIMQSCSVANGCRGETRVFGRPSQSAKYCANKLQLRNRGNKATSAHARSQVEDACLESCIGRNQDEEKRTGPRDDAPFSTLRQVALCSAVGVASFFASFGNEALAHEVPPPVHAPLSHHTGDVHHDPQHAIVRERVSAARHSLSDQPWHTPQEVATIAAKQEPVVPVIHGADTAWVMISTILVLSMTLPGLALFYGGLVRAGSINSMLLQHMAVASVVSLMWVAFGYSAAFSTEGMVEGEMGLRSVIGGMDKAFLNGVTEGSVMETIPESLWVMFQMTFAIISPCIILGAFAERMKFSAVMVFTSLWVAVVYLPIAHAVWAGPGALLGDMGALDFAGGLVVHIAAGFSGLMAAIMIGPRKKNSLGMHSAPMMMIGTSLLWVGWMGFNAGSALTASAAAASALINTQVCTAASVIAWMILDGLHGKPSLLGACAGAVTGLVIITPAAGFVGVAGSACMGILGVIVCRWMVETVKPKFAYDDSLDAFGIHGIGGFVGNLLVGIFAHPMFGGNQLGLVIASQCTVQMFAGCVVALYSLVGTYVLIKMTSALCGGLRVPDSIEDIGTDHELLEPNAYNAA